MAQNNDYWPMHFTRVERRRFTTLVRKAAARQKLHLSGEIPFLVGEEGEQVNVQNLLDEVAAAPHCEWSARIEHWFSIIGSSSRIMSGANAMSPEIANMSLRIRLIAEGGLPTSLLTRPSLPGLVAALFISRPGFGHGVHNDMLASWGIDIDRAFERARRNSLELDCVTRSMHGPLFSMIGPSIYSSTHALSLSFDDQSPLVLGIPTRHCVVGARIPPSGDNFAKVYAETIFRYNEGPGPTFPYVWFVEPSTFGPWGEGAELVRVELFDDERYGDGTGRLQCQIHRGPRLDAYLNGADSLS